MKKNYQVKSLLAIVLVVLVALLIDLDFKNWRKTERVIEHDIHSYYGYLPALFIYDDLKVEKSDYKYDDNGYWFWMKHHENGTNDLGKTYGLALFYSPFFFAANLCAKSFDYPLTGFSEPYKFFLLLSSLFYLFVGLVFVKKTLQKLGFSESAVFIVILTLGLGTNLLGYSSQSAPMPHTYNFSLFSIFMYATLMWHNTKLVKYFILVCFSFAFISLIYLPNSIVAIFFILFGINSIKELPQKSIKWYLIPLFLIVFLIVWYPQFKYWNITTGSYLGAPELYEKFYFSSPKIVDGLFSFRKGWLIYTPIMVFSIIGMFFLRNEFSKLRLSIIVFTVLNLYVVFSWWNWWYSGSYGQRVLIDSYPLLAIPFAAFFDQFICRNRYFRYTFFAILIFCVWLNIFQTYQYERQSLHYSGMTKSLYFKQFGKLDRIEGYESYLSIPDEEQAKRGNR